MVGRGLLVVMAIALLCYPLLAPNSYLRYAGVLVVMYAVLSTSWNLVGGFTGYVSLGHAAFFGLGAYGTALMVVLTANVIARYVLATGGFDWAEEVPQQVFPWFIMAGVALAVQHGGHVAVEWLLGKLGREGKRAVLLAGHALVVLAYAVLCWQALVVADIVSIETSLANPRLASQERHAGAGSVLPALPAAGHGSCARSVAACGSHAGNRSEQCFR